MPEFKKGENVQLQDESDGGYVVAVSEDKNNITWKNATGKITVSTAAELKEAKGMGAFFRSEGPDMIEIGENTAAFALIQGVTRNKVLGMQTFEFLVENALYEVLLKAYGREYAIISPLEEKYPLTQEQMDSWLPSMPQLANAANKAWGMIIVDSLYRLARRRPQFNKERFVYILKTFAAVEMGNYGHNLWATRDRETYKPQ